MRLDAVAKLLEHPGPFATVLLDVSRDIADAAHQIELRWRAARETLEDAGAPKADLCALEDRLLETTHAGSPVSRFLVATDGDVVLDDTLRQRDDEVVAWGPLPDVTTWVAHADAMLPVLVVVADREGADFETYEAWGRAERPAKDSVHGDTLHIRKVTVGDWAHKQFQRRSEELWRHNAADVAREIDHVTAQGVNLVVLAGDVRARREIEEAVSARSREALVAVEHGSRAAGGSDEELHDEVRRAAQDVVVERRLAAVRELEQRQGRDEAVAVGLPQVLDALVRGQVDTVLLAPEAARDVMIRPADYPALALPAAAAEQTDVRADLAVVVAAAATSAEVTVVSARVLPDDGVAALLRWDQS